MIDLRMHEALRLAEIEIGRLRTRNRELESRIREQEEDVLAGDIDGAEIQNKLAELEKQLGLAREALGIALLENARLREELNPRPQRLGDCWDVPSEGLKSVERKAQTAGHIRSIFDKVRKGDL